MVEPENLEESTRFEADALTIHVAQSLLEKLEPGAQEMSFYIDGHGRFLLVLADPWAGLERR